jgi:hypothetical protein
LKFPQNPQSSEATKKGMPKGKKTQKPADEPNEEIKDLFVLDTKGDKTILSDISGKKRKRQKIEGEGVILEKDEEELRLEKQLFGDETLLENFGKVDDEQKFLPPVGMKPAWDDEDDHKLALDVSSVRRLRKLRKNEKEKVISGAEYSKRLRNQ